MALHPSSQIEGARSTSKDWVSPSTMRAAPFGNVDHHDRCGFMYPRYRVLPLVNCWISHCKIFAACDGVARQAKSGILYQRSPIQDSPGSLPCEPAHEFLNPPLPISSMHPCRQCTSTFIFEVPVNALQHLLVLLILRIVPRVFFVILFESLGVARDPAGSRAGFSERSLGPTFGCRPPKQGVKKLGEPALSEQREGAEWTHGWFTLQGNVAVYSLCCAGHGLLSNQRTRTSGQRRRHKERRENCFCRVNTHAGSRRIRRRRGAPGLWRIAFR